MMTRRLNRSKTQSPNNKQLSRWKINTAVDRRAIRKKIKGMEQRFLSI